MIEAFVEKIVASKDGFEWYFCFDGDPNDPLKCKVNGRLRKSATYTIGDRNFPAEYDTTTGSPQGLSLGSEFLKRLTA